VPAHNLFVLGRGLGLGAAQEAALKFKETCGLHAEAYSSAEVKHGPMALVGPGFPVLVFAQPDETGAGTRALAAEFRARGAQVWLAAPDGDLPL
ncbi:MAG: SIS domain-containing protein, partial [Xanthomonas perforans]|nr:SIS domain-containing protein [Xanthomonas perforans]